jgi:acyl-CoA reductase-like NAD-dependent aldehyde dehydrogenase
VGALYNAGQICISVERVYVEEPIYEEFVRRVVDKVSQLSCGMDAPGEFATDYGAMLTANQLAIVERHVQDARDSGATIRTGGRRAMEGLVYEPTVFTEVDHTMACMQEETFGPTLPIMRVASIDEAVRLANDSPYGLSGSVWTRNERKGRETARRMNAGSMNVNNVLTSIFQLPVPMSGWGTPGWAAETDLRASSATPSRSPSSPSVWRSRASCTGIHARQTSQDGGARDPTAGRTGLAPPAGAGWCAMISATKEETGHMTMTHWIS